MLNTNHMKATEEIPKSRVWKLYNFLLGRHLQEIHGL